MLGQTAQDALLPLGDGLSRPARPIIEKGPLVKELIRRHQKNLKPLVDTGLVAPHADATRTAPPLRLVS